MFQYASAKGFLYKNEKLYIDLSFLKENSRTRIDFTARKFELNIFPNIDTKKTPSLLLYLCCGKTKISKYLKKIGLIEYSIIKQNSNEIVNITKRSKILYLDGYFQSETYFKHIKDKLIHEFLFPDLDQRNEAIKQHIYSCKNATSIHIRRGDYVTNKSAERYHGILSLQYYLKAFDTLYQQLEANVDVFLFTDDIAWAKDNFILNNRGRIHFIAGNEGNDSWKDMALMTFCKHHIVANSSFSWWGAWLSKREGFTFAPKHWFNKKIEYNIYDIVPKSWILID